MLGVIFLAGIQILHTSFAYLYGRQRQFLFLTLAALVVSFSVALVLAIWLRSLIGVAIGQLAVLAAWWLANEGNLRETSGQTWKDWLQVIFVIGWCFMSYGVVLCFTLEAIWRIPMYYALVVPVLWFSCREEIRFIWRLIRASTVALSEAKEL